MANTEIQSMIAEFAARLEALAKKSALDQVIASLGGQMNGAARGGRRPGRPKGSTNKPVAATLTGGSGMIKVRKGTRRSAEDVAAMGETLIAHVRANPGQRADEIAKALRTDPGTMRLPMQALLAAKAVKTIGQRRGTKYFLPGAAPRGPQPGARKKRGGRSKK